MKNIKNLKKVNKLLGIDFSETNISLVELQIINNKIIVTNGFQLSIPTFKDINNTIALIKQNLKTLNIKTRECSIGYAMQYFKLFPVPLPKSIPQDEINSIIIQEGNIDTNEFSTCWLPLNNTRRDDPDGVARYDILGVSVNNSLLDVAKIISQKCGLKLLSVVPSFLGLSTVLVQNSIQNLVATLWVSQIRSELVVWYGHEPIYEHLFLTHQLQDQIFQSINHIQSQLPGVQIASIYVYGPHLKDTNLKQIPFNIQQLVLSANSFDLKKIFNRADLSDIVSSVGVALYSSNHIMLTHAPINLLNPIPVKKSKSDNVKNVFKSIKDSQVNKAKEMKVPSFTLFKSLDPRLAQFLYASIFVSAILFGAGVLIQNYLISDIELNQSTLSNRISFAQVHLAKLLNFEKTYKVLSLKHNYLSELIDKRRSWSKIIHEIGDMTPKELWIDRLDVRNNNVDIFGRALNVDAVANYSININYTAKLVDDAKIIALRKFEEDGLDIVEFQISANVKNQPSDVNKENKNKQNESGKNLSLNKN